MKSGSVAYILLLRCSRKACLPRHDSLLMMAMLVSQLNECGKHKNGCNANYMGMVEQYFLSNCLQVLHLGNVGFNTWHVFFYLLPSTCQILSLARTGISGPLLQWFSDYLTNRQNIILVSHTVAIVS